MQYSIRLLCILTLASIILMSAFVGMRHYVTSANMDAALNSKAALIAQRVAYAVQPTIWNIYQKSAERVYSEQVTSAILDSELADPNVIGVSVYGNFGHVFMARYKDAEGNITEHSPARHKSALTQADHRSLISVRQGAMTIGNVLVLISDAPNAAQLRRILIIDAAQILIVSICFILFLFYAIQKALIRPAAQLKEANAELEEFSYRITHDLRSPIVSSLALIKMSKTSLERGNTDQAILEIEHIIKSLEYLDQLNHDVFEVLTIARKDERIEPVNIENMIQDITALLSHLSGGVQIDLRYDYNAPPFIHTKPERLRMIIENLVSNAMKYKDMEEAAPFIKFTTNQESGVFMLEIEDNGIGIPEDMHQHVFKMFKRFHPKVSFGSGLGLYLAQKSAHIIGAEIKFIPTEKGTKFKLSIPLQE